MQECGAAPEMPTMPAPLPITTRLRRGMRDAMPRGHAWWIVLGACALGLLLFMSVWMGRGPARDDGGDADGEVGAEQVLNDLPAPLPAAATADRGFDYAGAPASAPDAMDGELPRAGVPAAPAAATTPPTPAPAPAAPARAASSDPRPISSPSPQYPRASLRRGERGDVVVLVRVGANGRVTDVELVSSSQHPRLDRAAMSAARRWRFEPAMRDGQPVPGELRIPFSFVPEGG